MMNKAMTAAVCACLAGIMALAPAAHAKGGGGHHPGGGGMKFSSGAGHHHHHHFRVFRRDTITVPSYNAEENRVRRIKPATPAIKAPVVKYADGKGRVYDPGSKAWCDGNGHCWSGPLAWTFKDGTWFYGDARWYEAGGTWRTDAAAAPRVVDCESIPAFAALKPTTGAEVARGQTENASSAREASATAAPAATKSGDCKKYFPSIGGMVSVPCEG